MSKTAEVVADVETKLVKHKNLIWMLVYMLQEKAQLVSSWTDFNTMT